MLRLPYVYVIRAYHSFLLVNLALLIDCMYAGPDDEALLVPMVYAMGSCQYPVLVQDGTAAPQRRPDEYPGHVWKFAGLSKTATSYSPRSRQSCAPCIEYTLIVMWYILEL